LRLKIQLLHLKMKLKILRLRHFKMQLIA